MGVKHYKLVWEHSKQKGSHKLVMLALAERANDTTGDCYPSIETLAEMAGGISTRQVQKILRDLEAAGEIKTNIAAGRGHSNSYELFPEKANHSSPISDKEKVNSSAEKANHSSPIDDKRRTLAREKVNYSSPEPEGTRNKESAASAPPAQSRASPPKPSAHPAVVVYREIHERYPSKAQMILISEKVQDADKWRDCLLAWSARGYKPTNINGPLEWYEEGIPDGKPQYRNGSKPANEPSITQFNDKPLYE